MLRLFASVILVTSSLIVNGSMIQNKLPVEAEFPGASLKWIHIAERKFKQERLDLNNYKVIVTETDKSVIVMLVGLNDAKGIRGSGGPHPGFEVEISKRDTSIMGSNYIR